MLARFCTCMFALLSSLYSAVSFLFPVFSRPDPPDKTQKRKYEAFQAGGIDVSGSPDARCVYGCDVCGRVSDISGVWCDGQVRDGREGEEGSIPVNYCRFVQKSPRRQRSF